jgi:hypothetical protein
MNPDVAVAVDRLGREGVLSPTQTTHFGRVARGELLSVRPELRFLLYAGVLAIMAGVGILVRENLDRLGPVAIASGLWLAAAGALFWAQRHAPAFTWGKAPLGHLAFDYILLLGVLLTGAALAYTEVWFTPLGPAWSAHLLVMSLFAGALAVWGDSRMVAGLALSTFAAWRGVSASPLAGAFWSGPASAPAIRLNAAVTGLLFVGLGYALVRSDKKAHFEPLAAHLGWLLLLAAILSGVGEGGAEGAAFQLILLLVGTGLAVFAFRAGRFSLFGMGLVAAYIGLTALTASTLPDPFLGLLWFIATGGGVIVALLVAHHKIKARKAAQP